MCSSHAILTNTAAIDGIPTTDYDPGHEVVLVLVAQLFHQMRRDLDGRHPAGLDGELGQIVLDVVGQGLRVGRTSGAAAPDPVVELGDLVRRAVGDVRAGGDAGVSPEDDAGGEGDGDYGGSRGEFARSEVARFGRFAVVAGAHHGVVRSLVVREGAHWTRQYREAKQSAGISKRNGGTAPKVVELYLDDGWSRLLFGRAGPHFAHTGGTTDERSVRLVR